MTTGLLQELMNVGLRCAVLSKINRTCGWPKVHTFLRCTSRQFSADTSGQNEHNVAEKLKSGHVQKIVVMAGAGISTPSGIPDFRSPGTGLYDNLQKYNLPYPEAVFDIEYFHHDAQPFFTLARELYPAGYYRPNIVHYFIRLLQDKGLLLRMYTQNIDGLERLAGIYEDKLVEAHGTFHRATCMACRKIYTGKNIEDSIFKGEIPMCKEPKCQGVIKPDIVFFGEQLPPRFWMFGEDLPKCDLLVVMGTSLEVYPFAGIADASPPSTPRVLFNKDVTGAFVNNPLSNDVILQGDLVTRVTAFSALLGWNQELQDLMDNCENDQR